MMRSPKDAVASRTRLAIWRNIGAGAAIAGSLWLGYRLAPLTHSCGPVETLNFAEQLFRTDAAIRNSTELGRSAQCVAYKSRLDLVKEVQRRCPRAYGGDHDQAPLFAEINFYTKTLASRCRA